MHQSSAQAKLVGQESKPDTSSRRSTTRWRTTFHTRISGLDPSTAKAQVRRCLQRWNQGDNGVLELSRAYRLRLGTGWLVPHCTLHAPGSLCTFEPQWGNDVFASYQSMPESRHLPWHFLVKDFPPEMLRNLDYLVDAIDWQTNTDPHFKNHHYVESISVADTASEGYLDRWVVYGKFNGRQRLCRTLQTTANIIKVLTTGHI